MEDPGPTNFLPQLLLIFVLLLVNAFFAAAELAIVSINKNKIRMLAEEGNKKAKMVERLMQESTQFLSTIQVGITFANLFSSASAATSISEYLGAWLSRWNIPYGQPISLVAITLLLSYITLVFGELVPKRIALQRAEQVAMMSARPILMFMKVVAPFVKLLSFSTNLVLKLFGMKGENLEEKVSREEIQSLIEAGGEDGVFNETEKELLTGVFEFDEKIAEEVMTPRTQVYLINIDRPLSEYLDEMLEERHSRIPVFEGDTDNIIGILYMKDFLIQARKVGFEQVDIRSLLRPAYFVPERKGVNELFSELQASKKHMAVLVDEYGGFSGIVTVEDLIEEITGAIEDEFDDDDPEIKQLDPATYLVKGLVPIQELNDELNLDLDEDSEDYDTLGGFLIQQLGYIPEEGNHETLEYNGTTFQIERVEEKRIEQVRITLAPSAVPAPCEEAKVS